MHLPRLRVDLGQLALGQAYKGGPSERYPDPANLLPISVDTGVFVHMMMNPALTWFKE
jgi:hypothetical protein